MSSAQGLAPAPSDTRRVSIKVWTDPPGRIETPAIPRPRIAMHLGRSVYMVCQRGSLKHRGWGVHGDIDIVPADTRCIWEPDGPDTALIIGVEPELLQETTEELGLTADTVEIVSRFQIRDSQIEHICFAMKDEMEAGYPTGNLFFESLSRALASAMVLRHSSLAVPSSSHSRHSMSGQKLRLALSYIEDNLKDQLTLSDIAQAVNMSATHLKAAFRKATGVPVHQYVIQRRVERAKSLLLSGDAPIREVAQEAGFAHQSHMTRHMRRSLGYSPRQIRESERKTPHQDD